LEKDTCQDFVLPRLKAAGWTDDQVQEQFRITDGRRPAHSPQHRPLPTGDKGRGQYSAGGDIPVPVGANHVSEDIQNSDDDRFRVFMLPDSDDVPARFSEQDVGVGVSLDVASELAAHQAAATIVIGQYGHDCEATRGTSVVGRDELRALQAPLKERYRKDPAAALMTLQAEGTLGEGTSCSVSTGRALAEADLHPATGGDGLSLCSGDMLLQALAACAGVTLRAVAISLEVPIRGGTVHAEGDLDFRGTLAVAKDASVGFTAIRVRFDLDSDASEEQLDTLLRLTERYCVVYQTLASSPGLSATLRTA
jgi:uncharacterized OsmC-like protein